MREAYYSIKNENQDKKVIIFKTKTILSLIKNENKNEIIYILEYLMINIVKF